MMGRFAHAVSVVAALTATSKITAAASEVLQIHGSGTTNPSRCIWLLMDQFMARSKVPIRMTYRAVGSSTGIKEFVGVNNTTPFSYKNYNDFGAGDIPVPTSSYEALQNNDIEMVHLPFVMGSVGVFYNNLYGDGTLDDSGTPMPNVNLTGCNLARIFKREIVHWDDPAILADNPGLSDALPYARVSIHVARRVLGSSSTKSLTAYLNMECPEVWPESMVGSTVDWPDDTMECEGSAGMTDCVRAIPGSIGYMESGHGWDENLVEVELKNKAGQFLTSKIARDTGGIGGAASDVPLSADADFGHVNLLNKDGDNTWPITLMSYIFVRKDLSFLHDPQEQTLLTAFLRNLYDPDSINQCRQFGFSAVPGSVRDVALAGIDMLQIEENATEWTFESKTQPGIGMGDYVISRKRRTYLEYEVGETGDVIELMKDIVDDLDKNAVRYQQAASSSDTVRQNSEPATFTEQDATMIQAALAMSIISIILWFILAVGLLAKRFCGC